MTIEIFTDSPVILQAYFCLPFGMLVVVIIINLRTDRQVRQLQSELKQTRNAIIDFEREAIKGYTRDRMRSEVEIMLESMLLTAEVCGPMPFVDETVSKAKQLLLRLRKTDGSPNFNLVKTHRDLTFDYQQASIKQMEALS